MQAFWSQDWFAALAFSLAFVVLAYGVMPDRFNALERHTYDLGVRANPRLPSTRIVVIAIDERSVAQIGRYPWPRRIHAQMIDRLHDSGAAVVASTLFFSESRDEPGREALAELNAYLAQSPLTQTVPGELEALSQQIAKVDTLRKRLEVVSAPPDAARSTTLLLPDLRPLRDLNDSWAQTTLATRYLAELTALRVKLDDAQQQLSTDASLAQAMRRHGAVLLPMRFTLGAARGQPEAASADALRPHALTRVANARGAGAVLPPSTAALDLAPLADLAEASAGVGHLTFRPDVDGVLRTETLALRHHDAIYPSLALLVAAAAQNLKPADIDLRPGEGLRLGKTRLETSEPLAWRTQFYSDQDSQAPFPVYPFQAVRAGHVPANAFKDKIVLMGATAAGLDGALSTPLGSDMAPVMVLAHSVSSLLQGHGFQAPRWGTALGRVMLALVVAYLAFALPLLAPALGIAVSAGLIALLFLTEFYLLSSSALWIPLTLPALLIAAGQLWMTLRRLRLIDALRARRRVEHAESDKVQGLAHQGQGQLDRAFETFKRVQPVDDKLLGLIYNLAQEFERKRRFDKAASAYEFIGAKNAGFRDVAARLAQARKRSEAAMLEASVARNPSSGGLVRAGSGPAEQSMLGRYLVEKELGKGAMGVVYLGKDPKIGRRVAIKTMALSEDFASDDVNSVKARFFREAEAAGNLSHPHIVQIFDAGEEHDLAYIAMEFIQGHDLVRYTKPTALLPVKDALKFVADAAEALDYAHQRNVVHRDIKPANLMLVEQTRSIKVTDFGVARITDASKTKTGMVLGTPSYMSPEQLSGKKVDGRSDLFSLGVTLYQLLTGKLPFQAESMATLMYKIANEPHQPPSSLRPTLPPALDAILDHVLQKQYADRYSRGSDFAQDLRTVLASMN